MGSLGPAVEDAGTALFKLATQVSDQRNKSDDPLDEWTVREAIHAGWRYLIDRSLPTISAAPQVRELEEARTIFLVACGDLENATTSAQENEHSSSGLQAYFKRVWRDPFAQMADTKISAKRLVYSLLTVPARRTVAALDQLSQALEAIQAGDCEFSPEVAACRAALPAYRKSLAAYTSAQMAAASIGIAVARAMASSVSPPEAEPEAASLRE